MAVPGISRGNQRVFPLTRRQCGAVLLGATHAKSRGWPLFRAHEAGGLVTGSLGRHGEQGVTDTPKPQH